jgi:hypothetical protein
MIFVSSEKSDKSPIACKFQADEIILVHSYEIWAVPHAIYPLGKISSGPSALTALLFYFRANQPQSGYIVGGTRRFPNIKDNTYKASGFFSETMLLFSFSVRSFILFQSFPLILFFYN